MAQFNQYDSRIGRLSAIKDYCRENGCQCRYAKEATFIQQDLTGKYLGVVESGYFKYTVLTSSGNEAVVGFAFEGEIVADFYNSYNCRPSEISIKAGADSTVSQIRMSEARGVFDAAFDGNISSIYGTLLSEIYARYLELYRKTATERYLDLTNQCPHIFDIVSLKDIASYLHVTPVYLSRIRKKLADLSGE